MQRWNSTRGHWLLASAVSLLLVTPGAEAFGQKDHTPQIRVMGQGQVAAAPDEVSLDVAVVTRAPGASQAASDNAAITVGVLAKLKAVFPDAKEISTSGYALNAEYEYDKLRGERKPAGFTARNTIHVVLADVSQAGRLIDTAVGAGAHEVQSVRFSVSDPTPFVMQALAKATADARARAATLAEAMGARVGRTLRVEEPGSGQPQPRMMAFAEAARSATPVEPGDVVFGASVSLWVEIEEK